MARNEPRRALGCPLTGSLTTTVVSAVAVPEILYTTKSYIALYYKTYEMLAVMTGLCVLLFVPLSLLLRLIERRLQHGQFGS